MHAISSASPSHVHLGGFCYPIVVWTTDPDDGSPDPWIIREGELVNYYQLPFHLNCSLVAGTSPCIPAMEA